MKKLVLIILIWGAHSSSWCQVNQYWADITFQKNVSYHLLWAADGGPRFQAKLGLQTFYSRFTVEYNLKWITPTAGAAYFNTKSNIGLSGHEARLWQGFKLNFKISPHVTFTNHARLEERWLFSDLKDDFVLRLRFQTGFSFLLMDNKEKNVSLSLPVYFEFFDDLNKKNFINRNRYDVGLGYRFNMTKIEIHYLLQEVRSSPEEKLSHSENIYRLRWFFYL